MVHLQSTIMTQTLTTKHKELKLNNPQGITSKYEINVTKFRGNNPALQYTHSCIVT